MPQPLRDALRGLFLVAFFLSTLILSFSPERVFLSPDENANFFFAKHFADTGSLSSPSTGPFEHPRSIAVSGDRLVPGSFLGLPLLAGIASAFAYDAGALLVTPFLALFAVIAFWGVVRRVSGDEALADLSAFFFMLHPGVLYYSGRVMMHNVPFIAFLLFALFFAVARPFGVRSAFVREFRRFELFLSGLMVGVALLIRTSECVWVIPIFLGLLLLYRNELGWRNMGAALLGLTLMGGVILGTNGWVYGESLTTGYTVSSFAPPQSTETADISPSVLPFGFHPRAVLRNVWAYGVLLYPWTTIPAVIGFCLLAYRRFEKSKAWKATAAVAVFVAVWLFLFYGSWTFHDNPDSTLITIGDSHVRYWLPVFVLAAPFAAYGVLALWRSGKTLLRGMLVALMLMIVALSIHLVFFGHDGILPSRTALRSFLIKRERVLARTESDAVIIVDRADKYLFPYRSVVVPLRDEGTYAGMPELVSRGPLYYVGITFPESDLTYLNDVKLKELGLEIELVESLGDESLYRIFDVHLIE